MSTPPIRVRRANERAPNPQGDYVLYWMTANRRLAHNFALDRALHHCQALNKPLLILEALRCGYRYASDRFHAFVIEGMRDNAEAAAGKGWLRYYPYVEPEAGAGKGLLAELSKRACVVVGDDYPAFFLPRMVASAAKQVEVSFELVDANGILPLRAADRVFKRAVDFRRFNQKTLQDHIDERPAASPLARKGLPQAPALPETTLRRWPEFEPARPLESVLAELPIDHTVARVPSTPGGTEAARARLKDFLEGHLADYGTDRNHPDQEGSSKLSAYLHFGHLGAHEVFAEIVSREDWSSEVLPPKGNGSREGWWGMSVGAEAYLDQLVTWREIGFNRVWQCPDATEYSSLPGWALETLAEHGADRREHLYTLEDFERALTHDRVWNAAQNELRREGRIHNYLRMLWGKKIFEWSKTPQAALEVMLELNDRYAIDGRDPNSLSGIFWILGRYDRAWGPERPIYGKIRYMSTDSTLKKLKLKDYLARYGGPTQGKLF